MPELLFQGGKDVFLNGVRAKDMTSRIKKINTPKFRLAKIPKPPKVAKFTAKVAKVKIKI